MFETLAVVTPFSIIGIGLFILFFLFFVLPKIVRSKKIDKLSQDLTSDTTSSIIDKLENAKDGLADKSKGIAKTIKDAAAESEVIDKALGKETDKEE